MAERTVQLKLKIVPQAETKKALDSLNKVASSWDKTFGANGNKAVKNQTTQISALSKSWQDLGKVIKGVSDNFKSGFAVGSESMRGIKSFTSGIEGLTKKVFNLKTMIAGTVIGAGAIWGVKKIFEEGAQDIRTRKRLRREFGSEAKDIEAISGRVNFRAGLQDDEVARGLIPLAEQLQAIQGGARFRGMKGKLTEAGATSLRRKNLTFGAQLFSRVATMVPDLEPDELGRILGDALAGPEGIRTMTSALHLSKRSRTLSTANEKGQAFKVLTPAERKQYGVTKNGQFLEQGDLVNLLLSRSGITEKAADEEQKTFSHQIKQIKSTLLDQIGDIGSGALDTLTVKLGQGATAAERLQNYLKSDEGKKTLESVQHTVVKIVEGIADIVIGLPKIGGWLKEHKTLLESLAVAYIGLKAAPAVSGLAGGAKAVIGGVASTGGAIALAGALGVAGGAYLGHKLDQLSEQNDINPFGPTNADVAAKQQETVRLKAERDRIWGDRFKKLSVSPSVNTDNVELFGPSNKPVEITVNTHIDGQVVSKIVTKHMGKELQNQTARGTSPGVK